MDKNDRNKDLFANAMSYLMKDKLGISIDLLNEIIDTDPADKLALLARHGAFANIIHRKPSVHLDGAGDAFTYAAAYNVGWLTLKASGSLG